MKKYIYLFLVVSLILSLFSCTKPPETAPLSDKIETAEIVYTDSSPLGFVVVGLNNGTLMFDMYRIYPEEALMLPLCPDPLCKHKSNACLFYDMGTGARIVGNTMYYLRTMSDIKNYSTICSYNFDTDKFEVLCEVEKGASVSMYRVFEKHIFFIKQVREADKTTSFYMMRYDMDTGKVVELAKEKTGNITILNCENDRYYFCVDSTFYYSTDVDYKNRIDNDKNAPPRNITGGRYFQIKLAGSHENKTLTSATEIKRDDGEEKLVIEGSVSSMIFHNDNIIYSLPEKKYAVGYAYMYGKDTPSPVYEYSGGKYYICDADGSNQRVLLDLSGTNYVTSTSASVQGDVSGVGDYIILKAAGYNVIEESDEKGRKILET